QRYYQRQTQAVPMVLKSQQLTTPPRAAVNRLDRTHTNGCRAPVKAARLGIYCGAIFSGGIGSGEAPRLRRSCIAPGGYPVDSRTTSRVSVLYSLWGGVVSALAR